MALNKQYQERQSLYELGILFQSESDGVEPLCVIAPINNEKLLYNNYEFHIGSTLLIRRNEEGMSELNSI